MNEEPNEGEFLNEKKHQLPLSEQAITSSRTWLEVRDVMSRRVATVSGDETVVGAAQLMAAREISCVVVVENEQVVGIFTERDLLQKVVAQTSDFKEKKIREVMTSPVFSISPSMSILEASGLLDSKRIKRLPVTEDGRLVGIVTQTDLTRVLASYGMWRSAGDIMSSGVATLDQKATIAEVSKVMAARNISCLIALDGERVAGIVTERDIMKKIVAPQKNSEQVLLQDVMSFPICSVSSDQSIFDALRLIESKKIRRVVVMDGPRLLGILTQTDIFRSVRKKLEEEELKHLHLLERSENGIFTIDLNGITTYANPAFLKLLEIERPVDIVGLPFLPDRFWIDPADRLKMMGQLRRGGGVEIRELMLCSAKNRRIFATLFATITKNIRGEINGTQGILYDITDKKELVKLREVEEQLRRSNETLKKISEMKSDFVSLVSHELRAPMTVVRGRMDLVLSGAHGALNEMQQKSLRIGIESIDRLVHMVNNLLDLAKIEAGRFELKRDWVDLVRLAQFSVSSFELLAKTENLSLSAEIPFHEKKIFADEDRLLQVFLNLIGNAIKFTSQGGVKVSVTEKEDVFECVIADTGVGISEDELKTIFEKFGQSKRHDAGTSKKGTGLGLSIAEEFILLHGGKIWVESKRGEGSRFFFTIPKLSVEDVFRQTVADAVRMGSEKDENFSVILISSEFGGLEGEISQEQKILMLKELKTTLQDHLFYGADRAVYGNNEILVILMGCDANNVQKAMNRLHSTLQHSLEKKKLQNRVRLLFTYSIYPDDGCDENLILESLRVKNPIAK